MLELEQRDAWVGQLAVLRHSLSTFRGGRLYVEFGNPRLGRRIDAVVVLDHVDFVLEFKVGEKAIPTAALTQVWGTRPAQFA